MAQSMYMYVYLRDQPDVTLRQEAGDEQNQQEQKRVDPQDIVGSSKMMPEPSNQQQHDNESNAELNKQDATSSSTTKEQRASTHPSASSSSCCSSSQSTALLSPSMIHHGDTKHVLGHKLIGSTGFTRITLDERTGEFGIALEKTQTGKIGRVWRGAVTWLSLIIRFVVMR